MFVFEGVLGAIGVTLLGVGSADASSAARLDLLAREGAQWIVASSDAGSAIASPHVEWIVVAAAVVAAFLGGFLGMRSVAPRIAKRRQRTGSRSGGDVLERLQSVLRDVERVTGEIRAPEPSIVPRESVSRTSLRSSAARVTFARPTEEESVGPAPAIATNPRERTSRFEEARAMLSEGHEPSVVQARTGLRLAEIDLLRAARRAPAEAYA